MENKIPDAEDAKDTQKTLKEDSVMNSFRVLCVSFASSASGSSVFLRG